MKAYFLIIGRNIRKRKTFSAVIIILSVLASAFLISSIGTIVKTQNLYDDSYAASGESELIYGFQQQFYSNEFAAHFEEQESVESVIDTNSLLGVLDIADENIQTLFSVYDTERNYYGIFDSDNFSGKLEKNEVLAPMDFQHSYSMAVGDEFSYKDTVFTIAGFYEDPICGSPFYHTKRILLSEEMYTGLNQAVEENELQQITFLNINLKPEFTEDLKTTISELEEGFEESAQSEFSFNQYRLSSVRTMVPRIILAVLILFSVFLLGIMSLVIRYAILAAIEEDYASLGIMKAIGFKGINLTLLLLCQYLLTTVTGMIIGLIAACFITPPIGTYLMATSGIVWIGNVDGIIAVGISIIFLIYIAFIVYSQTRKARKVKPIEAIIYGKRNPGANRSHFSISHLPLNLIPISTRMGLKQLTANIGQYLTLLVLVVIFSFMMVNISGLSNAFNSEDSVAGILGYDINDVKIKITDINTASENDIEQLVEWMDAQYEVTYNSIYETGYEGYVDSSEIQLLGYSDFQISNIISGEPPQNTDEIMISSGISEELGKSIGDTINISLTKDGDRVTYTVVGINNQVYDLGRNITITREGLELLDSGYIPDTFLIKINQNDNVSAIIDTINDEYLADSSNIIASNERAVMIKRVEAIQSTLLAITIAVTIISLMLIALITFLVSMVVVHRETVHSGIMKSIGFTPGQLRLQFANRFLLITFVGTMVGMVISIITEGQLINLLFSIVNIARIPSGISRRILFQDSLFIIGASVISAWFVSRRFKKVNVRILLSD